MNNRELTAGNGSPTANERRLQLQAAAVALRTWVHARRATWSDTPEDTRADWPGRLLFAPTPPAPPVRTTPRLATLKGWTRASGPVLLRWSLRLGLAAALAAGLVVAAMAVRPYVESWLAPKSGTVVFRSDPSGSQVTVDNKAIGVTPFSAALAPGRHLVVFRHRDATRTMTIEVESGRSTLENIDWRRRSSGRLQVTSDPPGSQVMVDDRIRGVTPLTIDNVSVGVHDVVIESPKGQVRRTVTVDGDRTAFVSEAIYPGWLRAFSPLDLQISEGPTVIHLDDRNQVLLPAGRHQLQFENAALGYHETRTVELKPGEITAISIIPPPSTITVTATLPSEVLIDGVRAGETPVVGHPIALGTRDVVVKSAAGDQRRFALTIGVNPARLDVNFSSPPR